MAMIIITHDMGVIAEMAARMVLTYAGQVVEQAAVEQLFADPRHPYTRLLLRSVPRVQVRAGRMRSIEGIIHKRKGRAAGCRSGETRGNQPSGWPGTCGKKFATAPE